MAHVDHMIHSDPFNDTAHIIRVARLALSGGLFAVALVGILGAAVGSQVTLPFPREMVEVLAALAGTAVTAAAGVFLGRFHR